MKRITIIFKSGASMQFETNNFALHVFTEKDEEGNAILTNKIAHIQAMRREKGISFEYVCYDEIAGVISDTSRE